MGVIEHRFTTLVAPLSDRSIRRLWYARVVSNAGDWAARIALSLLVYGRTGSALAATLVSVASLLPHVGIGQLLATLADRYPHRIVMAVCDVARGVLYLALAVTHLPLPAVLAIAFVAGMGEPPFMAAHSAAMPQLAGDRYLATQTLFAGTSQAMTLVGFAAGGLLAAAFSPSLALAANGVSFLLSLVFVLGIEPTRSNEAGARQPLLRPAVRALTGDRLIVVSASVVTVATSLGISVEALLVAYAAHLGVGPAGTGLLATVAPLAATVAAFLLPSSGEHVRLVRFVCRTVLVLTVPAFVLFAADSPMPLVLVGFLIAGSLDVLTVPAGAVIGQRLPQSFRGTAFSFLEGALKIANACAAVVAGALAAVLSVPVATAVMTLPAIAASLVGLLLVSRRRTASIEELPVESGLGGPAVALAD